MSAERAALGSLPVLEDLGDLAGRHVLVRLDLNVPLESGPHEELVVADDFRIRAAMPTLEYLAARDAVVTVATHLGRPKGTRDPRFSVVPVSARLRQLGADVAMLENLRYSPGEELDSPELVASLIEGEDLFVNDAFGVMHRAHASVVGPPRFLVSAAGRLVEQELSALMPFVTHPPRPFVVVMGGAKVADKLGLLRSLVERADLVLVGGGMAFTFLHALGHPTGDSLVERDHLDECRQLVASAASLLLPVDIIGAAPGVEISPQPVTGSAAVVDAAPGDVTVFGNGVPDGWRGVDIGPATCELFREAVVGAGSVIWNGPLGVFEDPRFARGTFEVASAVAAAQGLTLVGGGDSAAALARFGLEGSVGHISTGGGASLALLEHCDLPGLAALRENAARRKNGELGPPVSERP